MRENKRIFTISPFFYVHNRSGVRRHHCRSSSSKRSSKSADGKETRRKSAGLELVQLFPKTPTFSANYAII